MHRIDAYRMIQRRAAELGLKVKIGCHTFRATGITAYLEAGGTCAGLHLGNFLRTLATPEPIKDWSLT